MTILVNDIPPTLPAAVQTALAAVILDRTNLNDDTTDWAALTTALAAAVTANEITQHAATALANAYGGGPTGPIMAGVDDIPPVLQPKLFAAVQAVALDHANFNDDKASAAALLAEAQAEVGANQITEEVAEALLAAYGVTYVAPPPPAPPPSGP